jgi:hypothetical protein
MVRALATAAVVSILVMAAAGSRAQQQPPDFELTCDNSTHLCRTATLDLRLDNSGIKHTKHVYRAPPGVSFAEPARGTEVEGLGTEHYVRVTLKGPQSFECDWYVRTEGGKGVAKGLCEVTFSGTAP